MTPIRLTYVTIIKKDPRRGLGCSVLQRPHERSQRYLECELNTSLCRPINVINVSYTRDFSVELVI